MPRFIWTAVGTAIYIAIAIPGYSHFEEVLENFMNFIGKLDLPNQPNNFI